MNSGRWNRFVYAGFLALAAMQQGTARAELLINGGFETPNVGQAGITVIGSGAEPLGFGWMVNAGTVEVLSPDYLNLPPLGYEGSQFLDLNGISVGTLSQSFATIAGQSYQLSFAYANNYAHSSPSNPATATVRAFNSATGADLLTPVTISHGTSTASNLNWSVQSLAFTATGSSTTLRFISTTPAPLGGIFLDGVRVTGPSAVPEPSTIWLMASGATVLLVSLCLRRRSESP